MAKKRIVIETSGRRKAALVNTLDLQGGTISDWLEEQLVLSIPEINRSLTVEAIESATITDLSDPAQVYAKLKAQDWAFTDDDTGYLTHDLHRSLKQNCQ